ncbi:MAG: hypothetical protein HYX45_03120 [Burkholderiales bacterium]|nr:hypothetical protein [Burkholderiales bacterium]
MFQKIKRGADANPGFRIMGIEAGTDTEGLERRVYFKPSKNNPALPYAEFTRSDGGRRYASHMIIAIPYLPNATTKNFKLSDLETAPLEVLAIYWMGKVGGSNEKKHWARETCSGLRQSLGVAPSDYSEDSSSVLCTFAGDGRALNISSGWNEHVLLALSEYPSKAHIRRDALSELIKNARAKSILTPGSN